MAPQENKPPTAIVSAQRDRYKNRKKIRCASGAASRQEFTLSEFVNKLKYFGFSSQKPNLTTIVREPVKADADAVATRKSGKGGSPSCVPVRGFYKIARSGYQRSPPADGECPWNIDEAPVPPLN